MIMDQTTWTLLGCLLLCLACAATGNHVSHASPLASNASVAGGILAVVSLLGAAFSLALLLVRGGA